MPPNLDKLGAAGQAGQLSKEGLAHAETDARNRKVKLKQLARLECGGRERERSLSQSGISPLTTASPAIAGEVAAESPTVAEAPKAEAAAADQKPPPAFSCVAYPSAAGQKDVRKVLRGGRKAAM